ncbi:sensor histidine kinase [Lysobacter sp. TAB13]|uniref:sensor histidine kinase n=1 Tax=Lysobacter sp. TAB13 TaxID=3233065 RepID=UPI003F966DD0
MPAHRRLSPWPRWLRSPRARAWALAGALALLVCAVSVVRVAMLDTTPGDGQGPRLSQAQAASPDIVEGAPRLVRTDGADAGVARIWRQGAQAIVVLLLLFGAYDATYRFRPARDPSAPTQPPPVADTIPSGDMLAIAGDRMRQSLHAVSLFAGSLNHGALPAQRDALHGLEACVRDLACMIEEVEQISRLLRHEVPVRAMDLPVAELFDSLRGLLVREARGAGVEVRWHSSDLCLRGDALLAERLVHVLVGSAIHRARHRVLVAARPVAGRVALQIRDDGDRLDIAADAPILDALSRHAQARDERDTALGLTVGARIAELLEVGVGIRRGQRRGNTIAIDFPRARPASPPPDDATLLSLALLESEARRGQLPPSRLGAASDTGHGGGAHSGTRNVEPAPMRTAPTSQGDIDRSR